VQQSQLPEWMQYVQILGPSFVAIIAAAIAGYIALRQWRTANHRLRVDMYDRRYAVYEATKALIDKVAVNGQLLIEDIQEYHQKARGSEFFFDGETKAYLKEISERCWRCYQAQRRQSRASNDEILGQLIDEEFELIEFIVAEGPKLEGKFEKFLDLSRVGL
jgi:hypothetical protein